jgi:hypothetical protein
MKWNSSWLMVLCVIGMGALLFLPALGVSLGGLLAGALFLLCPLSHLLMMRGMSGHGDCHGGQTDSTKQTAQRANDGAEPSRKAVLPPAEVPAMVGQPTDQARERS